MLAKEKVNLLAIFIKYVKSECKQIIAYLQGAKEKMHFLETYKK